MLELKNIRKAYCDVILDDICYSFENTGLYLIKGKSGSGKTTLLNILSQVDREYTGDILYNGLNVLNDCSFQKDVRIIFQQFSLFPFLKVKHNAFFAGFFNRVSKLKCMDKILNFSMNRRLIHLSGGQKQRIAIHRAMCSKPKILLCDEPTGSLDHAMALEVMTLLKEQAKNCLVIVVSHDESFDTMYDEIIAMEDGKLATQLKNDNRLDQSIEEVCDEVRLSLFKYCIYQLQSKWKRNCKIIMGVSLGIFTVLLVISISTGAIEFFGNELKLMFPESTIAIKAKNGLMDFDEVKVLKNESNSMYYEVEDYVFLGLGRNEKDEPLFIGDATKQISSEKIAQGTIPTGSYEVVLNKSTAYKLFKYEKIEDCIGETLFCFYTNYNDVLVHAVEVVGLGDDGGLLDTVYFYEEANINHIKTLFGVSTLYCNLVLMDVVGNAKECMELLSEQYNQLDFKIMAEGIDEQVSNIEEKVFLVIIILTCLIILSATFLIGQVLYLSVIERSVELVLSQCYGASIVQVCFMVIMESMLLLHGAFFIALFQVSGLITVINNVIFEYFSVNNLCLSLDSSFVVTVYCIVVLIGLCCSFIPCNYAIKLDKLSVIRRM